MNTFPLPLIEGKCFVSSKNFVTSQQLTDHFYVDRWAPILNVRGLEELSPLKPRKLVVCNPCVRAEEQKRDNLRAYMACNAPLRTMELFAGRLVFQTLLQCRTHRPFFLQELVAFQLVSNKANLSRPFGL